MPSVTWMDGFLPILLSPRLNFVPVDAKRVLDVGCGRGVMGGLLRVYREPELIVALDIYKPYLSFVRTVGFYDEVLCLDLSRNGLPFDDSTFDLVLCMEVLEHLPKQRAFSLLNELERVSDRVVVTTPTRFYRQSEYDDNIHQLHRSVFRVDEFENRGYQVYGVGDLLFFGRPIPVVSEVLGRFSFPFPGASGTLLATKNVPHPEG